jgi:hypothetical protein
LRGEADQDVRIAAIARTIQTRKRKVREDASQAALLVSGKSARVGGKADVRLGLPPGVTVPSGEEEAKVREALENPLLVLYLLRGEIKSDANAQPKSYKDGLLLPALGMHFPGQAEDKPPTSFVRYRLNKVGQEQLFAPSDGDDDISPDLDDDD